MLNCNEESITYVSLEELVCDVVEGFNKNGRHAEMIFVINAKEAQSFLSAFIQTGRFIPELIKFNSDDLSTDTYWLWLYTNKNGYCGIILFPIDDLSCDDNFEFFVSENIRYKDYEKLFEKYSDRCDMRLFGIED